MAGSDTKGLSKSNFCFSKEPSLECLRNLQCRFANERDWDKYHKPRNLVLALVGEVGELAEIFQWKGEVEDGLPDFSAEEREHVGEELSDVLLYLIRLAEKCQVDLPQAAIRKIKLNSEKYPAERVHGSSKKYTEYP
ncbi:dCTP pyrophosphatase 1-like [Corticium candelabrum]|uniref:dCTP pyrophosphatase 1-like n=1 Tax=Corticium candelabrum TaxID=121492 RepID=UPI002E2754C2|nr:dCTP pyrophosphatase 1-like [Corticium candelabrum]